MTYTMNREMDETDVKMANGTMNDETVLKLIALHRAAQPTCGDGHGQPGQSATSCFKMKVLQEPVPEHADACRRWSVCVRRKGNTPVEDNPKKCAKNRCGKELRPLAQQARENGRDSMQCLLGARGHEHGLGHARGSNPESSPPLMCMISVPSCSYMKLINSTPRFCQQSVGCVHRYGTVAIRSANEAV